MSAHDGVYYIRYPKSEKHPNGRTFVVVPVHQRNDKEDGDWQNGGIQAADRGSMTPQDAEALLKKLGCTRVWNLKPGLSPNGVAEQIINGTSQEKATEIK